MKKTAIIYGATDTGKRIYNEIKDEYRVIGFTDGDPNKWGGRYDGIEIYSIEKMVQIECDYYIVGVLTKYEKIVQELIAMEIPEGKIISKYVDLATRARADFVEKFAVVMRQKKLEGAIAEVGVYQGEFSGTLGKIFPEDKFYLFDTFEGLPVTDVEFDNSTGMTKVKEGHFSDTSVELVLSKICNNSRCLVHKGYFPESAEKIDDRFIFVNLDVDLYKPTKAGLYLFWEKMVSGGGILIHDYFSTAFLGAKKAVDEFCEEKGVCCIPIGDTLSVVIVKDKNQN